MTLEDFISESLTQIINGVRKAQIHACKNGAKINSKSIRRMKSTGDSFFDEYTLQPAQVIEFDIAVSAKEQGHTSARAGVFVTVFGAGIEGKEANENFLSNRIKFSIPISLPIQKDKDNG